jgi:hypothetical protein
MKSFDTWTYEQVEDTFGIAPIRTNVKFAAWLNATDYQPNIAEKELLDEYRELLFEEVQNWNEDELKLFFIGPVLGLIHFKTANFKPFTQRTLTIDNGIASASGKVDFMLAKGKMIPKTPYFCLHEYKQENRRENDPLGQLLIGMVAAQSKNTNPVLPIYGCYVSGRNWFFVLLEGTTYCLSDAYVATSEAIYTIFAILKKCKFLVDAHAKSN